MEPGPQARHSSSLVDLGDPTTWPGPVRLLLDQVSRHSGFHGRKTHTADLGHLVNPDHGHRAEGEVRAALLAFRVLAYHATRLLPHENGWIQVEGMPLFSDELRQRKLSGARAQLRTSSMSRRSSS